MQSACGLWPMAGIYSFYLVARFLFFDDLSDRQDCSSHKNV
ncbi:hypothetical protein D1BOALGB6SA_3700 [Olavius sp. associated proteobacterium Delta 1]|nr:hypothetical protein D1BOALGB6SA_3700 [Olavius sp. associated proteobacterium Delta 1]